MSLPEISDEAWAAANDAHWSASPGDYRPVVRAAWPHLYAAALRHAAECIERDGGVGDLTRDTDVAMLREWADEATS